MTRASFSIKMSLEGGSKTQAGYAQTCPWRHVTGDRGCDRRLPGNGLGSSFCSSEMLIKSCLRHHLVEAQRRENFFLRVHKI